MLIGADTETHRFRRGWMTPRMVCMTLAARPEEDTDSLRRILEKADGNWIERTLPTRIVRGTHKALRGIADDLPDRVTAFLLDRDAGKAVWPALLAHDLVFHEAPYDVRVALNERRDTTAAVAAMVEDGRLWDTVVREKLLSNAHGELSGRICPFTGKFEKRGLNTLSTCVMRYFGVDLREEKTDPEAWRLRYADLEDTPVEHWPDGAITYAMMDAVWALLLLSAQDAVHSEYLDGHDTRCPMSDHVSPPAAAIPQGMRRFAGEWHQTRVGLPLTTAASWGWRANRQRSEITVDGWRVDVEHGMQVGMRAGFVVENPKTKSGYSVKTAKLRERISQAYGGLPIKLFEKSEVVAGIEAQLPDDLVGEPRKQAIKEAWEAGRRALTNRLCAEYELDPDMYSDSGQLRYATEILQDCGDPELEEYAQSANARTYLERYAAPLLEACEVPLTYGVDSMKATMRTSKFDPAMDQPPRNPVKRAKDAVIPTDWPLGEWYFWNLGYRECFEPRPGTVFLLADMDQAELRAISQYHHWHGLGDELRQMFLDDIDPHEVIAADILNADGHATPDGSLTWDHKLVHAARKGAFGPEWADRAAHHRQIAKALNFGRRGGLGKPTFIRYAKGQGVKNLTIERVGQLFTIFAERFPCDMNYLAGIGAALGDARRMTMACPVSGMVRGGVSYTSGANTNFQHLIALVTAYAMWLIWKDQHICELGSPLYGTRTLMSLHDEVILEVPEERAHECAIRVEELVEDAERFHMPDIPPKTEAVVSRIWSKKAKRVVDPETGRIVPWEPT